MSHRLDWRKLEGVGLGNGTGLTKPQDKAPVVTEWRWPDKAVSIEEVSDAQRNELSIRVTNGECKLHHQAKDWVGIEIAYVMGWDLADKAVHRRVRQMVDAWLEEGFFVVTKRRDPIKREMKDYVEIGQT